MTNEHYLAYGSNLHPRRLLERTPSAKALALVHLPRQRLTFHKQSKDGSSKCNLLEDKLSEAYGVLYEMTSADMKELHRLEGPGYLQQQIKVPIDSVVYMAVTYVARAESIASDLAPYHWYKELVASGADYFGFPKSYINSIRATSSLPDPDTNRAREQQVLLDDMAKYPLPIQRLPLVIPTA